MRLRCFLQTSEPELLLLLACTFVAARAAYVLAFMFSSGFDCSAVDAQEAMKWN